MLKNHEFRYFCITIPKSISIKTKLILKTKFFEHNLKHCPIIPNFFYKKNRYFRIKISILLYYYLKIHTLTLKKIKKRKKKKMRNDMSTTFLQQIIRDRLLLLEKKVILVFCSNLNQ